MSQECCWIFPTVKSCRDNRQNDIHELSFGHPLAFSPKMVDENRHPILYHIHCLKFSKINFKPARPTPYQALYFSFLEVKFAN